MSSRIYQIVMRHEKGSCPSLPSSFQYANDEYSPWKCPVHSVFTFQSARIALVRRRTEELKAVKGIVSIWLYHGESVKESDSWQKIDGRWERV